MDKEHNRYIVAMILLGAATAPLSVMSKEPSQLVEQLCSSCHSLNNLRGFKVPNELIHRLCTSENKIDSVVYLYNGVIATFYFSA